MNGKPTLAHKQELREEIAELRLIGEAMSNICFNLGQRRRRELGGGADVGPLHNFDAKAMDKLRIQWDAIKRRESRGRA